MKMELNQTKALCRACLAEEGIFQSIFLVDSNLGFSLPISEMLSSFSMIQVIQGDGLPEQICTECVEKTVKMFLFKLKFEESDVILRARLKKVSLSNKENSIKKVVAKNAELLDNSGIKAESNYNSQTREILIDDFARFKSGGDKEMSKNEEEIKISSDNLLLNKHSKINEFQCNTFQEMVKEDDLLTSHKIAEPIIIEELEIKDEHCFQVNSDRINNANLMPKIENDQKAQVSRDGGNANLSRDQCAAMKIDLKNKPYGCDTCFEGFSQKSNLRDHLRSHNSTSSSDFLEKSDIFTDLQNHTGQISLSSTNSSYSKIDKKISTSKKPYELNVSKEKLTTLRNSTLHKKTIGHKGRKLVECDMCEKKFTRQHLIMHKRIHTGEKPFECDVCEKKFTQKQNLLTHKRIHTGEKPFDCDMCKKKFTNKQNLITHIGTHTGKKPFECDMCEKKFIKKLNLITHIETHTGKKPFECDMCEKKFSHIKILTRHKRSHTREKSFDCDLCEKKFKQMHKLILHKRTHTGDKPFDCDICEKKFTQKQNLIRHKRIHTGEKPFECDICKKNFTQKQSLITHLGTHTGIKPFKCDMCEKKFTKKHNSITHKRIHTGEKPFDCDMCDKKFKRKHHLITHKRTHTARNQ